MIRESDDDRYGTQSIERAITLLREVSTRGHGGWQLSELAAHTRLGKSTTHRLLSCLVRERLLMQRPADRHYLPGPMLFELGLALPELSELQCAARSRLTELAEHTKGAAFLFLRSADEIVIAVRAVSPELKTFTIFLGSRRPLIASVGGVAILLELPRVEARGIIRRNLQALRDSGAGEQRIQAVRTMLKRSYAERFAVTEGYMVAGANAYGLALRDKQQEVFGSISVAGLSSVLSIDRLPEMQRLLRAAANDLRDEVPKGFADGRKEMAAVGTPTQSPGTSARPLRQAGARAQR